MTTTKIKIEGLHCNSCKILIEDVCSEIHGINSCSVNLKSSEAIIDHKENLNLKELKKEIESLGSYKVIL